MNRHEPRLVRGARAKACGLLGQHLGRHGNLAQLTGLAGGEVGVVGPLALKRDDVGGCVDAAPLAVEVPHGARSHHAHRDGTGPLDTLLAKYEVKDARELSLVNREHAPQLGVERKR